MEQTLSLYSFILSIGKGLVSGADRYGHTLLVFYNILIPLIDIIRVFVDIFIVFLVFL